jgi:hypothetical protein
MVKRASDLGQLITKIGVESTDRFNAFECEEWKN